MKKHSIITLFALILLLVGCASTPNSHFYVLSALSPHTEDSVTPEQSPSLFIGTVPIPDHLTRPVILTQTDDNELAYSEFHRWGGDLDNNIRETLTLNLSELLSSNQIFRTKPSGINFVDYRIDLQINYLSGTLGKEAQLQASWSIYALKSEEFITIQSFEKTVPLTDESRNSYVSAQSKILADLSREIAAAIPQP